MKLRRDILLFAAVAIAAVAGGWWLLAKRPGVATDAFVHQYREREQAARPRLPQADAFRATVCPQNACVAVEAGGLTFVYGAGSGAADGIRSLGLLHPNLDAILLPDTSIQTVEGLADLALASGRAGRTAAITVYAPSGALPVVDGANLTASTGSAPRLSLSPEGENQGLEGRLIFDSGVVAIRGFGGDARGAGRVYRVDFDGKSLILGGCLAQDEDVIAAARGTKVAAAMLMAGASQLLPGATPRCTDLAEVLEAARLSRLAGTLILPAEPAIGLPEAIPAWREVLAGSNAPSATLGTPGAQIDLSGPEPRVAGGR